jgi:uncharacterized membrane protein HdeD (DUF308 family)
MAQLGMEGTASARNLMWALEKNWWVVGIRGVLAVLFGLVALLAPGATMLSLVLVFAVYALVDGLLAVASAVRAAGAHERWGYLVFEGLVSIAAAAAALAWPGLTVPAFVFLVAVWAVVTGILEIVAAIELNVEGHCWLAFGGAVSLLYGLLLIVAPIAGAVVLTWWLGAYALVFGVALIVLAFKLRAHSYKRG